jgi:hypothetical protein
MVGSRDYDLPKLRFWRRLREGGPERSPREKLDRNNGAERGRARMCGAARREMRS